MMLETLLGEKRGLFIEFLEILIDPEKQEDIEEIGTLIKESKRG